MKKIFKLISIGSLLAFITAIFLCSSGCAGKSANVSFKGDTTSKADTVIYDAYEGRYELVPNFIIKITQRGDSLYAQATGQQEAEIYPESETKFFYKVVDAQIEFNRNKAGEVESLTLFQNGQEMPAKKLAK